MLEIYNKYKTLFNQYGVNTPLRLAHFFGQADHESGVKPRTENLNYSVDGLLKGFGRHRISEADARAFGRTATRKANQQEIANRIYGGEWGRRNLGNTQQNDGWLYRGSGIYQITGRTNFQRLTNATKIDYINNPEWLQREADSLIAALWFWNDRKLNQFADKDDVLSVSKVINLGNANHKGTPKGLQDRIEKTNKYKQIFK
jgi:putative chitinase